MAMIDFVPQKKQSKMDLHRSVRAVGLSGLLAYGALCVPQLASAQDKTAQDKPTQDKPTQNTPAQPTTAPVLLKSALADAIRNHDMAQAAQILKDDPAQANAFTAAGESALYVAIRTSRADMVRLLLESKANPNPRDSSRQPAIFNGMDVNNIEILSALTEYGANLDGNGRWGRTPLTRATIDSAQGMTRLFLKKGAKPGVMDQKGMLPLIAAVLRDDKEITSLYLESGASTAVRSPNGSTPLHAAAWRDNLDLIKLLLQGKADPNAPTAAGDTPLHIAALKLSNGVPTLIAAGADPNRRDKAGDLPLHLALRRLGADIPLNDTDPLYPSEWKSVGYSYGASFPSDEITTRLLAPLVEKSDVNARDSLGISPLLLAVLARQPGVRDLIKTRGPKADATTQLFDAIAGGDTVTVEKLVAQKPFLVYFRLPGGTTPLHVAALWGSRGAAELLLKKGADINARDAQGKTPLRLCTGRVVGTYAKRVQVMTQLLLDHKAQLDIPDENGLTPLLGAVRAGNTAVVEQLVAAKSDTTARDTRQETALHLLAKIPKPYEASMLAVTATLLLKSGTEPGVYDQDGNTALLVAVRARNLELIKALLANGADPNQADYNGAAPLVILAENFYDWGGRSDTELLARALLDAGADANATTSYNGSVLLRAVDLGNKSVVGLLLDYKANPNGVRGAGSETPLTQAIKNTNKDLTTLLLDKGADPTLPNTYGETPLSLAQRSNKAEIVALLQAKIDAAPKK